MKFSDILKKLGIDLDSEIDETSTEALDDNKVLSKNEKVESKKENETKQEDKLKEDKVMAFVKPKVDKQGLIDITNIEDADLKAFLKELNDSRKTELAERKAAEDKRAVSDGIAKYAAGVKFAEGWSVDDALKLGDFSKVLNDENMTKEIENAFTNLKTTKATMFVADKETKKTESVLTEGFNPQNVVNSNNVPNSFAEAFSMME